eukprot:g14162.t1
MRMPPPTSHAVEDEAEDASPVVAGQGFSYNVMERPNFFRHNFGRPLTSGGVRQSVLALTSTAIGGGLLTLPYAMRLTGMGLGAFLLILGGLTSAYSIKVLMVKTAETGAVQYGELVGKKFTGCGTAFDVLLSIYGFGVQVAYFNFVGDFMSSLGGIFFPGVPVLHDRSFIIFAILVIVVPLSVPKSLSALKYCSLVGAVSLAYTSALIIAKTPLTVTKDIVDSLTVINLDWNFFIRSCDKQPAGRVSVHSLALGNFVFAYNCHLNVCPVAAELEVPTGERIHKVTYTAVFVQIFFYLGIAICGYLSFGTGTESDILLNYDADDPWAIVSRFCLAVTLLFALPINLNPTLRAFLAVMDRVAERTRKTEVDHDPHVRPPGSLGRPPLTTAANERAETLLAHSVTPAPGGEQATAAAVPSPTRRRRLHDSWVARFLSAVLYTVGAASVACVVKNPSQVIGLTSAAIGTLMMFLLPAFFAGDFRWPVVVLFVMGGLNGVGAVVMLLQAASVLPNPP